MAWFSDSEVVHKSKEVPHFTKIWKPGDNPKYPGIYRCQSCGYEDVINRECASLPPCTNCKKQKHTDNTWKLVVRAEEADE